MKLKLWIKCISDKFCFVPLWLHNPIFLYFQLFDEDNSHKPRDLKEKKVEEERKYNKIQIVYYNNTL